MHLFSLNEFSALYYPYATPQDLKMLKRAMFTFDKLYLIYPTQYYYDGLEITRSSSGAAPESHLGEEGDLFSSGFLEIINPHETVEKFEDLMINCYYDDLDDAEFTGLGGNRSWILYKSKVPRTILDRPEFRKYDRGDEIELPFAVGVSVMISHAVFSSMEKNLTPITNDPEQQRFLNRRLRRGLQFLNSTTYESEIGDEEKWRLNRLIAKQDRLIDLRIPDASELVSKMTLKDIINFRDANRNLLRRYRQGMSEMASYCQYGEDTGEESDRRIGEIINDKIEPVYQELREIIQGLPKFAVRLMMNTSPTLPGGSWMTVIGGLPNPFGAIASRETAGSRDVVRNVLSERALYPNNLKYLLHD